MENTAVIERITVRPEELQPGAYEIVALEELVTEASPIGRHRAHGRHERHTLAPRHLARRNT